MDEKKLTKFLEVQPQALFFSNSLVIIIEFHQFLFIRIRLSSIQKEDHHFFLMVVDIQGNSHLANLGQPDLGTVCWV